MDTSTNNSVVKSNSLALLPLLVFLSLFIGTGIYLTIKGTDKAFYQLSAAVAVLPAIIIAIMQGNDKLPIKINRFIRGVGESNIITMAMIYLLAGAFASVASSIGGVSSTVNLGLSFIPPTLVLPGLFVIAAFVATAMGTSMGTVAAIVPIALGIGQQTDISLNLLMGVVVGGAMFGDNLSMISDTTIAATRTQGCELKDKFIFNFRIALPVAIVTLVLLFFTTSDAITVEHGDYSIIKVLPYITILIMAIMGINVFVVLLSGILFSGLVGMVVEPDYFLLAFAKDIYGGFASMNEIMILSMLLGGLGELIKCNGGIAWLLEKVSVNNKNANAKPSKKGEWYIAFLAAFADISTANNTVAIVLTGGVAKEIAKKNNIDPRRSASILDIVSCVFQGILPYSAQVLLAGSIAGISPISLSLSNWYCLLLGIAIIIAIGFGIPKIKPKQA